MLNKLFDELIIVLKFRYNMVTVNLNVYKQSTSKQKDWKAEKEE